MTIRDIVDLKMLTADAMESEKNGNHLRWRSLGDAYLAIAKTEIIPEDIRILQDLAKMAYAMETNAVLSVEETLNLSPFPFSTPETNEFMR